MLYTIVTDCDYCGGVVWLHSHILSREIATVNTGHDDYAWFGYEGMHNDRMHDFMGIDECLALRVCEVVNETFRQSQFRVMEFNTADERYCACGVPF